MRLLSGQHRRSTASWSAALGSVLTLAAGLLVALAPTASAKDSITDLGTYTHHGDLVVGGDTVAVSLGDRIVIADTTGELQGTITGLSGATGLAMTADGTRLYAALMDSNEVAEINTATREITRRIDLAAHGCPYSLALTGDRLWVGYGCGTLGALGLDLSVPTAEPTPIEIPFLTSMPSVAAAGNTLVVSESHSSPVHLFVYDVSGAAPVLRGDIEGFSYRLEDLAVTPDGSHIIAGFLIPDSFEMWDATTLSKVRSYHKGPEAEGYPATIAVSADGAYIAGGRRSGVGMTLYDTASGAPIYTAAPPEGELLNGSAAFSGRDIFSLLLNSNTGHLYLWRLQDVTLPASTLALTAPEATARQPLTLTGQLSLASGTAPGAQPLIVARTLPDRTSVDLPSVTTAADGAFTVQDTPPVGGSVTYTVRWEGDEEHRWSTTSLATVVRYTTTLTVEGPTSEAAGTRLRFFGELLAEGANAPRNEWIRITRTHNIEGGETATFSGWVSNRATYVFYDTPPDVGEYTYTVSWPGNSRFGPSQVSRTVTIHENS